MLYLSSSGRLLWLGSIYLATKLQFYVILKIKRVILDKRWKLYRRLYK